MVVPGSEQITLPDGSLIVREHNRVRTELVPRDTAQDAYNALDVFYKCLKIPGEQVRIEYKRLQRERFNALTTVPLTTLLTTDPGCGKQFQSLVVSVDGIRFGLVQEKIGGWSPEHGRFLIESEYAIGPAVAEFYSNELEFRQHELVQQPKGLQNELDKILAAYCHLPKPLYER